MWLTSAHVIGRVALIGLAAGLQLRADEPNDFGLSALDWEGLDGLDQDLANATSGVADNATSFALFTSGKESARYVLAGQYNTGTNLLAKLVKLNFAGLRQEDQNFHAGAAYDSYFWKHTKPSNMKPGVRADIERRGVVALVMVRDPMSWLQSMKKAPYDLKGCINRYDWLVSPCSTPPTYAEWHGHVPQTRLHLANIEAHWNEWTRDYQHMKDFGFADAVVVRYEDLVLDTDTQLARIASVLKLPAPAAVRHIHAPAKNHGAPNGRAAAILKLKNKPYLHSYTDHQKGQVCERLDMELMKQMKYTDVCH
jgi:hypothetical protein